MESVLEIGKKWSIIAKKFLGKRTEHMVKNRFNSLLRKYKEKGRVSREDQVMKRVINLRMLAINNRSDQTDTKLFRV